MKFALNEGTLFQKQQLKGQWPENKQNERHVTMVPSEAYVHIKYIMCSANGKLVCW